MELPSHKQFVCGARGGRGGGVGRGREVGCVRTRLLRKGGVRDPNKHAAPLKFEQVFGLQSGVDMEIIDLQNDIELKSRSRDSDFWGLVSREKFPLLTACALKVNAYFGSTYLCEMAFSQMKIIKSKYRSCLTDAHLTDCLRLAVCSYEPNYKELADSIQSQPSH